MMEFSKELIEKAKGAQNAQELVALAKAENVDLSLDQATEYMKTLHPTSGEVADAELDNVSGGCGARSGERVSRYASCCKEFVYRFSEETRTYSDWRRKEHACYQCKNFDSNGNGRDGICRHP